MFKVYEGVSGPEFPVKVFARNQLAGAFEEADQNLDRLPFKTDFASLLLEFPRTQVKLEDPESDQTRGWHRWSHCIKSSDSTESSTAIELSGGRHVEPAGSMPICTIRVSHEPLRVSTVNTLRCHMHFISWELVEIAAQ